MLIRPARDTDLAAVQAIYAHHVLTSSASFELVPPTQAEMRNRYEAILAGGHPYLVADEGGTVLGYAYAGPYRARPAYRHTVEDSIYVAPSAVGRGVGRALLARLLVQCEAGGWSQMLAVIGDSANAASIALHSALGFRHAGTLHAVGWKFGRWIDSELMQRPLGAGSAAPPLRP
jgi:phosphinothricin acetyltransferase